MNDLLLQALRCEPTPRPPIWLMRQAGRFLPQYRALRAKHSFRELVGTPHLAAQVTRLPLDLLGVDAAILFSDILVLAEAFGYTIEFNDGIELRPTDDQPRDVGKTLSYVGDTIRLLKTDLDVPLIGFCGGPYTVAKYMKKITPEWLEKITLATIDYLDLQIKAGVDVIQIFDSWAGLLEPSDFHTLALPYLKTVVASVTQVPVIVFCRGSCRYLPELVSLNPTCISFDWETDIASLRSQVPSHIAIQGNLNPAILKGPLETLKSHATAQLHSMQNARGYIFNLGHGVEPETPVENVEWLIKKVKSHALEQAVLHF